MACSSRTRVAAARFVIGLSCALALVACGHFSVDLLPAGEDIDGDGGGGGDGGEGDDGSISGDGATDAGADVRDGGGPVVCAGTSCPGVYVSGDVGNDNDKGTAAEPVKTLPKAIEIAKARGVPTDVYVAGKSAPGIKYADPLTIVEGVSLYGGYECSVAPCTWKRDPKANPTVLIGTNYRGIVVPDVITRATIIDGFAIFGNGKTPDIAPGGVAMTIEGAPTVRRCVIEGNALTGGTQGNAASIALAILGPATKDPNGPLIENNDIHSGLAGEASVAVFIWVRTPGMTGASVSATITNDNTIRSGAAPKSYGIWARRTTASTLIEGNTITSGPAMTGGELQSWGIVAGGPMTILRNRINVGAAPMNVTGPACTGDNFCGGVRVDTVAVTIGSNIIKGAHANNAAGVLISVLEGTGSTVVINGNTIDPTGNGSDVGSVSASIALESQSNAIATTGNVRNNIFIAGVNVGRFGVYEKKGTGKPAHLAVLEYNDFWYPQPNDMTDYALHIYDGANESNITYAQFGNITTPAPFANKSEDPQFDPNNAFHLKTTSGLIDKGTATEAPARDIDDDKRPKGNGIDIGADEVK